MAYEREYPNNIAAGGTSVKQGLINDDKEFKRLYKILSTEVGLSGSANGTRQCVLTGKMDSVGRLDIFLPGTQDGKPVIGIAADEVPIILDFANGFADTGAKDILARLDERNLTAWKLVDGMEVYLYIDYNISTGAITYGSTPLQDIYAYAPPKDPNLHQHWYDLQNAYMFEWDGAAWRKVYRIFVGHAKTYRGMPIVTSYYAGGQTDVNSKLRFNGNTISYINDGKLCDIEANRFLGTATTALNIPVGSNVAGNIWIEEV